MNKGTGISQGNLTLDTLPPELITHILSFLDYKNLTKAEEISQLLRTISNDSWRKLISRYFPYLVETKKSEFEMDPKGLFINECNKFKKRKGELHLIPKEIKMSQIMSALNGELDQIDLSQPKDHLKILYFLAAANGHASGLRKLESYTLTPEEKQYLINLAARSGNEANFKEIINKFGSHVSKIDKYKLLSMIGARTDQKTMVNLLWNDVCGQMSVAEKVRILTIIPKNNVSMFMNVFDRVKESPDKSFVAGEALVYFVRSGDTQRAKVLLNEVTEENSELLGEALILAVSRKDLRMVNLLLEKSGIIPEEDKGKALIIATTDQKKKIVQALLNDSYPPIRDTDKKEAEIIARKNGSSTIADLIQSYLLKKSRPGPP